jgi:hypothetical protein
MAGRAQHTSLALRTAADNDAFSSNSVLTVLDAGDSDLLTSMGA